VRSQGGSEGGGGQGGAHSSSPPPSPAPLPLPEYVAKVARLRRSMAAAEGVIVKAVGASAALRTRVEGRERERSAKRAADASAFSSLASR
jgi:hypothetical protein